MDPDAEAREQRRLARERLVAVAQAHRDRAAERNEPGLREALDEVKQKLGALTEGLAAVYAAAAEEEDEQAGPPKRRLTLIYDSDRDAG